MNCSVIDIGANTIRLNVYSIKENKPILLFSKKETCGLASYNEKGILSDEGIEVLIAALQRLDELLHYYPVEHQFVFATASLRKVKNSQNVIDHVKKVTGIEIDLVSDKEEARLGFLGISSFVDNLDKGISVDIGGGSTEIVYFENSEVKQIFNLDEGSLSLHKKYVKKIISKKSELKEARAYLKERVGQFKFDKDIDTLIGIGGTIRSAGKILAELKMIPDKRHFTSDDVHELYAMLCDKKSKKSFEAVMRVSPDRIHTIQVGLVILITICDFFKIKNIRVSTYGIREGYILNKLSTL